MKYEWITLDNRKRLRLRIHYDAVGIIVGTEVDQEGNPVKRSNSYHILLAVSIAKRESLIFNKHHKLERNI